MDALDVACTCYLDRVVQVNITEFYFLTPSTPHDMYISRHKVLKTHACSPGHEDPIPAWSCTARGSAHSWRRHVLCAGEPPALCRP